MERVKQVDLAVRRDVQTSFKLVVVRAQVLDVTREFVVNVTAC